MNTPADRQHLVDVYHALDAMHSWRGWHWWPEADPFEVCVGCILVQNTMWTNVERAIERLKLANALTPSAMAALDHADLEELIRPSGQYRQKALKLRAFLELAGQHGGFGALMAIPAAKLRPILLACFGIGPETADAMICYASRQPAFAADAYSIRLYSRLGLGPVASRDYHLWQRWVLAGLKGASPDGWGERDLLARYHALIVMHCKHLCLKNRPKCGDCSLVSRCEHGSRVTLGA
ncbi:endonuclease [Candidatus Amarobacter glycogenicus]|uniref:endonuclease III domain-containing protein n=1 Tax=Candidatus Amarobacter glycogenicus TaxID=3140699 RepID=UPI0031CCA355